MEREHVLPLQLEVRCLRCGASTAFSVDQLAEDGEGPLLDSPLLCQGCGNDLDARLERDLRRIADAVVSIRYFLPPGRLLAPPRREKAWAVRIQGEPVPGG